MGFKWDIYSLNTIQSHKGFVHASPNVDVALIYFFKVSEGCVVV